MVFELSWIVRKYPIGKKVEVRRDEYIEEVTIDGYEYTNGAWYINTKECGTFLLSRLMMLEKKRNEPATIQGLLENLKDNICTKYCRFPQCYEEEDELTGNHCFECPLYRLVKNGIVKE